MEAGKSILLVAQKIRRQGRSRPGGHVRDRLRLEHPADAQAARRHGEGAGRGRHARAASSEVVDVRTHWVAEASRGAARRRAGARSRGDAPRAALRVRPVREAEQEDPARDPHLALRHRRGRAPRRHRRRAPAAQARAEAAGARDVRRQAAPRAPAVAARDRDRHPAGREAHPRPRQAADGEEPARVLPERAGEGDPEGARRGRGGRGPRGDGEEDQARAHAQGRAQEGRGRAEEAEADVADVGRGHGGAQLHRDPRQPAVEEEVEDLQGHQGCAGDPRQGPLRPGEGEGAHRRVPGGADARRQDEGADPVPGGRARRGQDLARPVDRQGDQPQVRAHVARRRARRGRDPRPPPHLHRLDAGQDPAEHDARCR